MEKDIFRGGLAFGVILLLAITSCVPSIGGDIEDNSSHIKIEKNGEPVTISEDPLGVEWSKTYGSYGTDFGNSARQTTDGGYIIVGETMSYSPDGYESGLLIKTDAIGNIEWYNTYGELGPHKIDVAYSVDQTMDGGYIFTGNTISYGAEGADLWLVKTDSNGNEQWNKIFGGDENDHGYSVRQADDGGYVAAGTTDSYGGGGADLWLIKTDSEGNEQWNRTFGTEETDKGWCVDTTADGGYILTGYTTSYGIGPCDAWLIKTDAYGIEEWNRTFGSLGAFTGAISGQQTTDGGYILCGWIHPEFEKHRALLIKTDSDGYETWNRTYGETSKSYDGRDVQQTTDGGYIIAGLIESSDAFLIKTDADGIKEWEIKFEEDYDELFKSVRQTSDGGYIIGGFRDGIRPNDPLPDFWLVKVGHVPDITITKPENALYLFNNQLLPFFRPFIIGGIDVEVDASDDEYDIEKVDFYVDDELQATDTSEPYSWKWNTITFFRHVLKAVAYNTNTNSGYKEIIVSKFF